MSKNNFGGSGLNKLGDNYVDNYRRELLEPFAVDLGISTLDD